jgi:hypothetical protein
VSFEEGQKLAQRWGVPFFEVSAKTGTHTSTAKIFGIKYNCI